MRVSRLTSLRQAARSPWVTLTPLLAVAFAFRLYDLDAVTLVCDEPQDMPAAIRHSERLNPFDLPQWLQQADPSQSRLPYYLTAVGVRLLSGGEAAFFWTRAGRVDDPPHRARVTIGTALLGTCLVFAWAAPPPLRRWSWLLPTACAFALVAVLGQPELPMNQLVAGRTIAGLVGVAGVWATYMLAREVFGHWAGLIAAATLSVSTTHIAWSRCAVTTGDTFVTTLSTLAVWLLYRVVTAREGRAMIGCSVALGLAFGAKMSAVLLWPVCAMYVLVWSSFRRVQANASEKARREPDDFRSADPTPTAPRCRGCAGSREWRLDRLVGATLLNLGTLPIAVTIFFWPMLFGEGHAGTRCTVWLSALTLYVAGTIALVRSPWLLPPRHVAWLMINLLLGGMIVAGFSTPYHLRVEVIGGLQAWWRDYAARPGDTPNYAVDLLSILELLWLQTGFPVNVLAVGGLLRGCRRRNRIWSSLFFLIGGLYTVVIILLHQKAPYYMLPLIPLLHALGAGMALAVYQMLMSRRRSVGVAFLAALGACWAIQFNRSVRIHPHYLVDGQQWASRLIFSPKLVPATLQLQGARPVVEWLAANASPGSRVAVFFSPERKFRAFEGLTLAMLAFEVQRSKAIQAKGIHFRSVTNPEDLSAWDYILLFPDQFRLQECLSGRMPVFKADIKGECGAVLYSQRSGGKP